MTHKSNNHILPFLLSFIKASGRVVSYYSPPWRLPNVAFYLSCISDVSFYFFNSSTNNYKYERNKVRSINLYKKYS